MTKAECIAALTAKMDANHAEVQRQLEHVAQLPGHTIHEFDERTGRDVDLLHKLSVTYKEGRALAELVSELVVIIYPDETTTNQQSRPEARPS